MQLSLQVGSLGWEDPLEKEMATHSSFLDWRIPWTEEPGRSYRPCGHREPDTAEHVLALEGARALQISESVSVGFLGRGPGVTSGQGQPSETWAQLG